MKTIALGLATEVERGEDIGSGVRIYLADGRAFMGTETTDLVHVCGPACAQTVIEEMGGFVQCDDPATQEYVCTEADVNGEFATADVSSFDAGDDTYVLCGACKEVLHADGPAHFAAYGTLLPGYVPADDEDDE